MAKTNYKKIETITRKIDEAKANPTLNIAFSFDDKSVQAELRIYGSWAITVSVEHIQFPKNMRGEEHPVWDRMWELRNKIVRICKLSQNSDSIILKASNKTIRGSAERKTTENNFRRNFGNAFLEAYRKAKKETKKVRERITLIQAEQKALLNDMRRMNSEYMAERKAAKAAEREANTQALVEGRFWDADKQALKDYFHPPYDKNYLAEVSKHWRAALFLECESISYKTWSKTWGHKLGGTGRAYLCGIDDNGDEWGHECEIDLSPNDHGDGYELDGCVEEAMAALFGINQTALQTCKRQGDLLFCSINEIPETIILSAQEKPWKIRESHTIESSGLMRNGHYFKSENEIHVTHTSHQPVTLTAGEYRLYELQVTDAD